MDKQKSKTPQKNSKTATVGKTRQSKKQVSLTQKKNSIALQRCKNWLITQNSEQPKDQQVEDLEAELSSDSGDYKLELVVSRNRHQIRSFCRHVFFSL